MLSRGGMSREGQEVTERQTDNSRELIALRALTVKSKAVSARDLTHPDKVNYHVRICAVSLQTKQCADL